MDGYQGEIMDFIEDIKVRAKEMHGHIMSYLEEGDPENLVKAVRHYPEAGGKRMRPILAQVVAEAVGGKGKEAIPFGVCLEIIHNFTLVHDDVMDEDEVRRGRPAVHVLFDVPTAIIAGDALFARAFEILSEVEVDDASIRRLLKLTSRGVWLIAEGQQMDINNENNPAVTIDEYLETVERKTAVLFACASEGGAIIGGGTEDQIQAMHDYAISMGIGFQIWDDVLGITADESKLGKPVGSDIRNGKRTLIVLHAIQKLTETDPEAREGLLKILGDQDAGDAEVNEAIALLERTGSIEHARQEALGYAADAKDKLKCIKDCPEKEFLTALVDYAVGREL